MVAQEGITCRIYLEDRSLWSSIIAVLPITAMVINNGMLTCLMLSYQGFLCLHHDYTNHDEPIITITIRNSQWCVHNQKCCLYHSFF